MARVSKSQIVDEIAREGINPKTKEKIKIPASIALGFKASDKLKDIIK
jgi:nucleoid DNA-binding protein